jgi:undecaprenyl-diphosphatase
VTLAAAPVELQAAILGVVQGLTEFLPVSSSAHLVVVPKLLGWDYLGKGFDVALHVGTLLVLLEHFRDDLPPLWRGLQRLIFLAGHAPDRDARLAGLLVVGSIPAAIAGLLLEDLVEPYLQGILPIAVFSILWGALLGWADGHRDRADRQHRPVARLAAELSGREAFSVGCAQACALLPGTSRSGVTTTAGLLLGLDRLESVRFSLLLSLPVIAGAALFKALFGCEPALHAQADWLALAIGVAASWLAGRACLTAFIRYLTTGNFAPIARYRVAFGISLLLWVALR